MIRDLLASSVSMRRIAKIVGVNKNTMPRKLEYLAKVARDRQNKFLAKLEKDKITQMQFDDLIAIEHTKLKPLSLTIAVDKERRAILGVEVSRIPAFGNLAQISRRKYGKRANDHFRGIEHLFLKISNSISPNALIESDEHKTYPALVKKYFPTCEHKTYKGGRACVAGQGELKRLAYDPLFEINHTCAMLRANINRLVRRTWCTTKDPARLKLHLDLFIDYLNSKLLPLN